LERGHDFLQSLRARSFELNDHQVSFFRRVNHSPPRSVSDGQYILAFRAFESIATVVGSADSAKIRMHALLNPAPWALIMAVDNDLHIRRAIRRAANRIAFRMKLRRPLFEIKYFLIKRRLAVLKMRRYVVRNVLNAVFYANIHGARLLRLR
jgi:hypothetical protein